ncbi:site-specific integrase [Tsukamurella pseudospumae]|uniref:Tyr recombinase domain-containing protein n=1 Tax=Tsukamurella pseudospumae TaxID=239498 RepID=A0A138AU49_9ACTN|nr:site-specific integrase [Tsukamurella pseudospumae]KXP13939.1 hypothetical protein AXK60_22815 [Tsukamurella pseudospumae]
MATIEPYEITSGPPSRRTRYMVRYRMPNGRQTKKRGFTTKREAELFAATVEVAKNTGTYVQPSLGTVTVAALAPAWLERKQAKVSRSWGYSLDVAMRTHVLPKWGDTPVARVDQLGVEQWVAELGSRRSGSVTKRAVGILQGILDDAVKSKRIASNPARGLERMPKRSPKKHVYLGFDDVDALAAACLTPDNARIVYVLALCGLRWGELIALRPRDVDFLRRRLDVHRNAVWVANKVEVEDTKGRENRSVPVAPFVLDMLAQQCEGRDRDELLFPNDEGTYRAQQKAPRGWFHRAVVRSGIDAAITPHALRHTCASLTVSAGGNVLALARMLGHKDASVTLRVYADLFDSDLDLLADQLQSNYTARAIVPKVCPPGAQVDSTWA